MRRRRRAAGRVRPRAGDPLSLSYFGSPCGARARARAPLTPRPERRIPLRRARAYAGGALASGRSSSGTAESSAAGARGRSEIIARALYFVKLTSAVPAAGAPPAIGASTPWARIFEGRRAVSGSAGGRAGHVGSLPGAGEELGECAFVGTCDAGKMPRVQLMISPFTHMRYWTAPSEVFHLISAPARAPSRCRRTGTQESWSRGHRRRWLQRGRRGEGRRLFRRVARSGAHGRQFALGDFLTAAETATAWATLDGERRTRAPTASFVGRDLRQDSAVAAAGATQSYTGGQGLLLHRLLRRVHSLGGARKARILVIPVRRTPPLAVSRWLPARFSCWSHVGRPASQRARGRRRVDGADHHAPDELGGSSSASSAPSSLSSRSASSASRIRRLAREELAICLRKTRELVYSYIGQGPVKGVTNERKETYVDYAARLRGDDG